MPGGSVRHDHCLALHAPLRLATVRPPAPRPAMACLPAPASPARALVGPPLTARAPASPASAPDRLPLTARARPALAPALDCLPLTARARAALAPALDCLPLTALPGITWPLTSRPLAARPLARAVRAGTGVVDLDRLRQGRLRRVIDVVTDQHRRPQNRARQDER
jgi:hypothetical protein